MSLRERVVELINEAKLEADIAKKLSLLKQVAEIVVHRERPLLNEFLSSILEFEADRRVDIRKWLIEFLESLAKSDSSCTNTRYL